MYFAIQCLDKDGHSDIRAENRPAHLDYLKANERRVLAAGPLLDRSGKHPIGSLLIMEFDDEAEAQAFAASDPYNTAGLFEEVRIRPWRKVLPES